MRPGPTETSATDARFGSPGPRMSAQHPLYMGFMGTVGVGFALLVYWIGSNTTQLLLWIITALFITLGLDPVVRWLEQPECPPARRHPPVRVHPGTGQSPHFSPP